MIDKVKKTIEEHKLLKKGDHVIVGVSGGPDSISLLHVLYILREDYELKFSVVHINHMLRGQDADEDEQYVKHFCQELNIPCYTYKKDIKAMSVALGTSDEEAGRKARYDAFFEVMEKMGGNKIAVAQNMNDQAETMLMRLARGSGLDGLSGIDYIRDQIIIRPLLDITREEIETYCEDNYLKPKIDKTNLEPIYTRNKVRLELIPYLKKHFNQKIIHNLWKTAKILQEDKAFIYEFVNEVYIKCRIKSDTGICLYKDIFNNQHPAIKKRILLKAADELGVQKDLGTIHLNNALHLIEENRTSAGIDLPNGLRVEIKYDDILLSKTGIKDNSLMFKYDIDLGKKIYIPELKAYMMSKCIYDIKEINKFKTDNVKCFDLEKINNPLIIRNRKAGDYFTPLGMKGSKKLKAFFIDEKVPKENRDQIPLVCCGNDIIWIVGYRISEKYKVKQGTKNILVLEFQPSH